MPTISVSFRTLPGTLAAVGSSGRHTLVADRPDGTAGGRGLGFNGGQLLAMAIGGCLCNDLRYVADDDGVELGEIAVDVDLDLDGSPALVTGVTVRAAVGTPDTVDAAELLEPAVARSTVVHSVRRGIPVTVRRAAPAGA